MTPLSSLPYPRIDPTIVEFGPFDIGPVALGPFAIRWYALAYIAGLVIGWWYMLHQLSTPRLWPKIAGKKGAAAIDHPATKLDIDDLLIWITFGVIVGGRLGYVFFYQPSILTRSPWEIFAVWHGGMSFHGGLLGVIIAGFWFCRRRHLDPLRIGDLVASAVPIGLFFGRLANFINAELWGRASDVPWAMVFPGAGDLPRHPSQLYEAALEGLALFIVLRIAVYAYASFHRPGFTIGLFACGYGAARIFVEFFREPDEQIGYLIGNWFTMGMLLSVPMIVIGVALMWRTSDRAPSWLKQGYAAKTEGRRQ